ncbi:hypothetical protein [uncultured Aquimarina sp.]|uniref:hypothetical protein n=1 Tax=uncultured Aquimarina sp. TaxID=575652 RepID=UPI002636F1BF|nr:hypothetical protein [uncultured Aquimarina sp.]
MKRKKLPKKKHKGMSIYCTGCNHNFSWTHKQENGKTIEPLCKKNGRSFSSCKSPEKHSYKKTVHIPGTSKGTTTKLLNSTRYEDAVIEGIEFRTNFLGELLSTNSSTELNRNNLIYLFDAQIEYVDFYSDVGVPPHKRKNRSKQQVSNMLRALTLFNEAIEYQNINKRILRCDKVGEIHVGYFHTYINGYAANTYNRFIGALKAFFKWAIKTYSLKIENPFEDVNSKSTTYQIETIEQSEFKGLLSLLNHKNGKVDRVSKTGKLVKKNMYRPFLKSAFQLALHTGGRREEIMGMKWSMIKEDSNGHPLYIEVPNLKVQRSNQTLGKSKIVAPKIIPVTKGLHEILIRMGYHKKKNNDQFIIYPNRENKSMDWLTSILSRSFSHFYALLGNEKQLQFKCLRKTYLTYLNKAMKGSTKSLSSHSNQKVLDTHYIDPKIISKAIREVEIFS